MIDQVLLEALQFALVETPDGGSSWLSDLWTRDEVLDLVSQRQSRLLKDTLLTLQAASPMLPVAAGQTRVDLPTDLVRLALVVWRGDDGVVRELPRSDSFEVDHLLPDWDTLTTATNPLVYTEFDTPTLQVQIAPASSVAGDLDILYVPTGAALTGDGVPLAVPDELAHALKYGTLADLLLKDGRGKDVGRGTYGQQRYDLAVELTRLLLEGWA